MTFFIPFCCSIGKLCLLNFLFSLSLIPILILAKIQKRDLSQNFVSRLFSLKEKNFLPFSFFIDLYYMYLCTLSHKLFLKCEKVFEYQRVQNFQDGFIHLPSPFVKTPLGNIILSQILIPFGYKTVSNFLSPHF